MGHIIVERFDQRSDTLLAHGAALLRGEAIDLALDLEQGVHLPDDLNRNGRQNERLVARRLAAGGLFDISEDEERASAMAPARRLLDPAWRPPGRIEVVVSAIGVSLENP